MRVFITGGAGFIGSHLASRFLTAGDEVVVYDNLVLGKKEFLAPNFKHPKFNFVEADLLDMPRLLAAVEGCDLVYHMAANSDISQGSARTDVDMQNGTIATYNVLEAMRIKNLKQLVFASTSAIYGEASLKPTPESYGPLAPISFYGASKLACEAMISAFSHCCGINAWLYRFANIVGSHATHGAIHDFVVRLAKQPNRLEVLGNGTQRKSYLHVQDCIDGMAYGHRVSRQAFQCFNLASQGVSNVRFIAEEVVRQMAAVTGVQAEIQFGDSDRGWVGDVPYTHLDGASFAKLGWQAKLDSDAAVRLAIAEVIADKFSGES